MTEAEKMAGEYLEGYEWPMAPHNIAALIHQIAERTREECVNALSAIDHDWSDELNALRNARWEDGEI